jgi:predicted transcriptional regulator
MPLVIIQANRLSADQKKRIGERIIDSFHREGIPASSVVVLYQRENADILLEGGLLIESGNSAMPAAFDPEPNPSISQEPELGEELKTRSRRTKTELGDLKAQLVKKLQMQGALSSFQAQEELGLKDCDWAPATLRRLFGELEEEGVIVKQGQKRGTRYVWKGITSQHQSGTVALLVKRNESSEDPEV